MKPYHYFPIHPAFTDFISLIAVMHVNFAELSMTPVYRFPWMNATHLFFPLAEDPLLVKNELDTEYHVHSNAYFVGPKLGNEIADFGKERHVVGITFKPGAIQRLVHIPGKDLVDVDIDATYIFGNSLRNIENRLKEARDNNHIMVTVEEFLFRLLKNTIQETPFDLSMRELLKVNGNLPVKTAAEYACKSIRQFERISREKLGMSPRLFSRLIRFGKVFSLKEARPEFTWRRIAFEFGYYDPMHLIRDFRLFTGSTPRELSVDSPGSVKMMAALHGMV